MCEVKVLSKSFCPKEFEDTYKVKVCESCSKVKVCDRVKVLSKSFEVKVLGKSFEEKFFEYRCKEYSQLIHRI